MNEHFTFHPFEPEELLERTHVRSGEQRIGEKLCQDSQSASLRFVILGIEESLGPRANYGSKGAENAFESFLVKFLNMQSNVFCSGGDVHILGRIRSNVEFENILQAREYIHELDLLIENILTPYVERKVIPIVIGGGHNNAYPLIKLVSQEMKESISVVNLDPHADCRALEGRHSGNSFSYAMEGGYLGKYAVIGLHQAFNNQHMLDYLSEKNCFTTFFESYLSDPQQFYRDLESVTEEFSEANAFGIELDMDCIAGMPSSAFTPSGFTLEQARTYVRKMALLPNVCYLHLPEAAPVNASDAKITGKALAYLTWDFISARISKK